MKKNKSERGQAALLYISGIAMLLTAMYFGGKELIAMAMPFVLKVFSVVMTVILKAKAGDLEAMANIALFMIVVAVLGFLAHSFPKK